MSRVLLDFLAELESMVLLGFGARVPGSRAKRLVDGRFDSDSQGPYPGRNALDTALFGTLAGIDHARLFAKSIVEDDASFALATLTRGSVEAYARVWWLLSADEDTELVLRWLSGLASELKMHSRVRPGAVLREMRGRDSNAADELERVLDDIERICGVRKPRLVSPTALVSALADQWNASGRTVYSDLSGVAHGESLGIHSFVQADDEANVYRTAISERSGVAYSGWVLSASTSVGRKVAEVLGQRLTPAHSAVVAHTRAAAAVADARTRLLR